MHLLKSIFYSFTLFVLCSAVSAGYLQVSVIDKDGKPVPDAVVVLVSPSIGAPKIALPQQLSINQEKMRFIPAISIVGVGAKARFTNNDPWEHHVRGSAAGVMQFMQIRLMDLCFEWTVKLKAKLQKRQKLFLTKRVLFC